MMPAVYGRKLEREQPLNWHFHDPFGGPQSTMRDGPWVLNAWWDVGDYAGGRFQKVFQEKFKIAELDSFKLYDIVADPGQANDLSEERPDVMKRLVPKLKELHRSVRDKAPIWS
jgi:arylsulfatase A